MTRENRGGESRAGHPADRLANLKVALRRPGSWHGESDLRRRARRRNLVYIGVAVACMALFVLLIVLLLERTRGTAGHSGSRTGTHAAPG